MLAGAGAVAVTAWSAHTASAHMKKSTLGAFTIGGLLPIATVAAATRAPFDSAAATSGSFAVTASSQNAADATADLRRSPSSASTAR